MKDIFKYCFLAAGAFFGTRYYNAYQVVKKLKFSFAAYSVDAVNSNIVRVGFWLNVENPTSDRLTITNSNLKVFLNSTFAGVCSIPYTQVIEANRITKIFVVATIEYKSVFSDWWNLFLQAATNVSLVISGQLRFNGVYLPVPALSVAEFNLKDTIIESKK